MASIEYILAGAAMLLLFSIVASKASDRLGVPVLLIFLAIGMLAGSDGIGGIHFDDSLSAQFLGVIALSLILFSGGFDTNWKSVKPVLWSAVSLSTIGVLITALMVGWFAMAVLKFSLLEGLLLGAIISSTDAAAVFSVLRSKNVSLSGNLKPLLELESGSNDPMAVFLTIGFVMLLQNPSESIVVLIPLLIKQFCIGGIAGYFAGRLMVWLVNNLKLGYEGLYPVLSLSLVIVTYGVTSIIGGNGFLAVYIAGLTMGNYNVIHKRSLMRFHDGIAWLMQISMFLVLGLLVYPSKLVYVVGLGLIVSLFLMFVARPVGVFISMSFSKFSLKEKTMVSWVGLRGAVPIILATFPLLAGIPKADVIFNMVFFIVLTSALIQGTTIPLFAKWLGVDAPIDSKPVYPIECETTGKISCDLTEIVVPDNSTAINKRILDLALPEGALVVLISRGDDFIVPNGGTVINTGDRLLLLADKEAVERTKTILETPLMTS